MSKISNFVGRKVTLALLTLMAVLAVGCGSSNNGFVSAGGGTTFTTGALNYQLRVNNVTSLPNGTSVIRFDLYDADGNLVLSSDATVSNSVEIDEVTGDVKSTTLTAFDQNGFPIGQVTVPSEVVPGQTTDIDLSTTTFNTITYDALTASPDPVELATDETQALTLTATFSNGSNVAVPASTFALSAAFTSNDTDVATVNANGVVTGMDSGNTTASATYTINGVSQSDTVDVNVTSFDVVATFNNARTLQSNEFDDWFVAVGTDRQPIYIARLFLPDNQTATVNSSQLSFTFEPAVSGFSVTGTGEVSVAANVVPDTNANLVVSYTDGNGRTFRDVMIITAAPSSD